MLIKLNDCFSSFNKLCFKSLKSIFISLINCSLPFQIYWLYYIFYLHHDHTYYLILFWQRQWVFLKAKDFCRIVALLRIYSSITPRVPKLCGFNSDWSTKRDSTHWGDILLSAVYWTKTGPRSPELGSA